MAIQKQNSGCAVAILLLCLAGCAKVAPESAFAWKTKAERAAALADVAALLDDVASETTDVQTGADGGDTSVADMAMDGAELDENSIGSDAYPVDADADVHAVVADGLDVDVGQDAAPDLCAGKECPAPDACHDPGTCNAATGLCSSPAKAAGAPCDDGNPCTVDACKQGACVAGANTCDCSNDAGCSAKEDVNFCNGTLFCNLQEGACEINPATVVTCPTVDDTACRLNTCQPKTGACALLPVAEALKPCDDGNACTTGDACSLGECQSGPNTCMCSKDANCAKWDDGNLCNGVLYCDKSMGMCAINPATVVNCPSVGDTVCQKNSCESATGKCVNVMVNAGGSCDADGNPCTVKDACQGGQCVADANTCQCQADGDCPDDGNLCNGAPYCDKDQHVCVINPATLVTCPTAGDAACQQTMCQPATGKCALTTKPDGVACSDGNACTAGDGCAAGQCKAGMLVCACQSDGDCGAFEDGDLCNGTLYCDKSGASPVCKINPATLVVCQAGLDTACIQHVCQPLNGICLAFAATACDDGNPCTTDACDSKTGCSHVAASGACSDGNPCTTDDACANGTCVPGANQCKCGNDSDCASQEDGNFCNGTLYCDKVGPGKTVCAVDATTVVNCIKSLNNICLTNDCDPTTGKCSPNKVQNGLPCDADNSVCTQNDSCADGQCAAGKVENCTDNNPCTEDKCDQKQGCVFTNNTAGCDADADGCTVGDACAGGKCAAGSAKICDDKELCTKDSCISVSSAGATCKFALLVAPCDDGNVCTSGDACGGDPGPQKYTCVPGTAVDCSDGNVCTSDTCDNVTGCKHGNAADSAPCSDGNACTIGDKCGGGACLQGTAATCNDADACTSDSCDPVKGCQFVATTPGCSDGNGCSTDSCDPVKGCQFVLNTLACSDGNACTSGDACAAGVCAGKAISCDDADTCTADSCDAAVGCAHVATGTTCGDGVCGCDDTVVSCATDCGFLLKRLGAACSSPGASSTCGNGYFCVARSTAGGGNVCVADFETWMPIADVHPASDFKEFTDYATDTKTGLMWAKESLAAMDWATALTACTAKTYGGFVDWRLPTRAELFSLTDRSKSKPACSAPNLLFPTDNWAYYSSVAGTVSAWIMAEDSGLAYMNGNTQARRARCVR